VGRTQKEKAAACRSLFFAYSVKNVSAFAMSQRLDDLCAVNIAIFRACTIVSFVSCLLWIGASPKRDC
jgi:hypothetical protein